ncbi:SagB/ThcOx family dehydrogenase [Paenibacillus sp. 2TAF8]|jgi:SagB-type dehydrogenase family enzyme|uniref:SagB/ThcOx family dehydrogenase n=1 Tax=Paenibacillus sp. 2TAF8 TaxID=3233020 RepID=UPI003F9C6977
MNKSEKHYVNVVDKGNLMTYIQAHGRKIPILVNDENGMHKLASDHVEILMRYFPVAPAEKVERIANYIYNVLEDVETDTDVTKTSRQIIDSTERLNLIHYGNIQEMPVYILDQGSNEANDQAYQRNADIISRMDENVCENYRMLVDEYEHREMGRAEVDLIQAADWYTLANPEILLLLDHNVVEKELYTETRLTRIYHENSKLHSFFQQGDFMKPLDEIDEEVKSFTTKGRKTFFRKEHIQLPPPIKQSNRTIEEVITLRRSLRNYTEKPVDIQTLGNILHYSYGITGRLKNTGLALRAVPSGGGLYPVDIYIAVNHVEGLEAGMYYYDPFDHELILVNKNELNSISKEVSGYRAMLDTAAFTVLLAANFWRNQWKYHERGYRVILLDCGHVAQNIHLLCTAYGLGSCCLMGFVDNEINKILELDGISEHSMYLITVGHTTKG